MTPRQINRLEHAARTAFGYDERKPSVIAKTVITLSVAAALLVLLVWLVRAR